MLATLPSTITHFCKAILLSFKTSFSFSYFERLFLLMSLSFFFCSDISKWQEKFWQDWEALFISLWYLQVLLEVARVYVSKLQALRESQSYKKFALIWKWGKYSIELLKTRFFEARITWKSRELLLLNFLFPFLDFVNMTSYLYQPININIFTAISIQKLFINNLLQCSFKSKFHLFWNSFDVSSVQNVFLATKLFGIS